MRKPTDHTGQRFGALTAKRYVGNSKWECLCDCGRTKQVLASNLTTGRSASCGQCKRVSDTVADRSHYPDTSLLIVYQEVFNPLGGAARKAAQYRGAAIWYDAENNVLAVSHRVTGHVVRMTYRENRTCVEAAILTVMEDAGVLPKRRRWDRWPTWKGDGNITVDAHRIDSPALEDFGAFFTTRGLAIPTVDAFIATLRRIKAERAAPMPAPASTPERPPLRLVEVDVSTSGAIEQMPDTNSDDDVWG